MPWNNSQLDENPMEEPEIKPETSRSIGNDLNSESSSRTILKLLLE